MCVYRTRLSAVARIMEEKVAGPITINSYGTNPTVPLKFRKMRGEDRIFFCYQYNNNSFEQRIEREWSKWSLYDLLLLCDCVK